MTGEQPAPTTVDFHFERPVPGGQPDADGNVPTETVTTTMRLRDLIPPSEQAFFDLPPEEQARLEAEAQNAQDSSAKEEPPVVLNHPVEPGARQA